MHSISMSGSAPPVHRRRRRRRSQTTIVIVIVSVSVRSAERAIDGRRDQLRPFSPDFPAKFSHFFPPNSKFTHENGGSPSVRSNWKAEDLFFLTSSSFSLCNEVLPSIFSSCGEISRCHMTPLVPFWHSGVHTAAMNSPNCIQSKPSTVAATTPIAIAAADLVLHPTHRSFVWEGAIPYDR